MCIGVIMVTMETITDFTVIRVRIPTFAGFRPGDIPIIITTIIMTAELLRSGIGLNRNSVCGIAMGDGIVITEGGGDGSSFCYPNYNFFPHCF
jgi:hypothetical protein